MKLVEFSVTNYRSVTTAHKIPIDNLTVLVGKNNEGKSNILSALNVAMSAVMSHGGMSVVPRRYIARERHRFCYLWTRDFPIQLQDRKSGLESIFRLNFRLEGQELSEFQSLTGIRGNEDIPISVKIGKDNVPKVEVPKRGSASYNKKSAVITEFISQRISFNYIQAVRTEEMALQALSEVIRNGLQSLRNNSDYLEARKRANVLIQQLVDEMSERLLEPLRIFIPSLQDVKIKLDLEEPLHWLSEGLIDVIIDDGIATSIRNKGDGIKSLVALALLKDKPTLAGASVIAIEEPESHLHSGAIHGLVDVIHKISQNSQVIITTHNPLFVQQNKVQSNILVENRTARPAKSISEIRSLLGVLPSDNLRNARFVIVVEGENDVIALGKILPCFSKKVAEALQNNQIVIKSMGGAGNLCHELGELKRSLCQYIVLLDNDDAGRMAAKKAIDAGLVKPAEIKHTICRGSANSEFEDCLNPNVYLGMILDQFGASIDARKMRGSQKWSERIGPLFMDQGVLWEENAPKIKMAIAECIPTNIDNIDDVIIQQRATFLPALAEAVERMLSD